MNERIRELIKQAMESTGVEGLGGCYMELNPEKFAELIVRECTSLLFKESERLYAYSSECNDIRHSDEAEICAEKCIDLITMIEEHFGVTE